MTSNLKEEIKKRDLKELKKLADLSTADREIPHDLADKILLKYCPPDIAEAWMKVNKWYS